MYCSHSIWRRQDIGAYAATQALALEDLILERALRLQYLELARTTHVTNITCSQASIAAGGGFVVFCICSCGLE